MGLFKISESRRKWLKTLARALLSGWRRPVEVVKNFDNLSAARIFLVHCIAIAGCFVSFCILGGLSQAVRREKLLSFPLYVIDNLADLVSEVFSSSVIDLLQGFLIIEIVAIGLADLLAPWCARDESMPQSIGASIHRVWAHSIVIPAMLILFLSPVVILLASSFKFRFGSDYAVYRGELAWYVEVIDAFITVAFSGSLIAYLVSLFRAVGAPREVAPPDHKRQCDRCGYSLIGTAADGNCPECGRPVADSIGPQARSTHDWKNRKTLGLLRAWWRAGFTPFSTDNPNLRRLSISGNDRSFQSYMVIHLLVIVPIVFLAQLPAALGEHRGIYFPRSGIQEAMMTTWIVVLFCLALILATAVFVSFVNAVRFKRNLAAYAMQAAAYQSFYLLWTTVMAMIAVFLLNLGERTVSLGIATSTGIAPEHVDGLVVGVIAAVTSATFLFGVFRATATARYASR